MPSAIATASLTIISLLLAAAPVRAEIVIGVAGPMSGNFSVFGAQMMAGAEQAVEDLNAAGGLLGDRLVLEVADDRCDRKTAESVANQMIGRRAALMVGHLCSGASIAASAIYADAGIVQISPGAREPRYTDRRPGPSIFRLAGRDDRQGPIAGAFLAERFPEARIAILHDGTPYGSALAEATRRALNEAGKSEVVFEAYRPDQADLAPLLARLAAASVDVLFFAGGHTEAGLIVRRMRDTGMTTQLVAGDTLMTEEFVTVAGDAADGALMTYPPDPASDPAAVELVARLAAKGIAADGYVLAAYAAVESWAAAVAAAGTADAAAVAAALAAGPFDTVLGRFSFDDKGDATLPAYVVHEWRDGRQRIAGL